MRWIVIILLLTAIVRAATRKGSGLYEKSDKMINLFTMISIHLQITLGIVLLFLSGKISFVEGWMKNPQYRFFVMEHIPLMVLAMVLITIGRKKSEKKELPAAKHKGILVWYTIVLIVILAAIPWPFRNLGTGWF